MQAYAVNPRRRRRRPSKRRRSFGAPVRRRRRRRSNPGVLRISNPRGGGLGNIVGDLLMPGLMVSLGAIAGTVLPRTLKLAKPGADKKQLALLSIGTAVALGIVGKRFLGAGNAKFLALGAASAGISALVNDMLPVQFRVSGIGQEIVTEADVDAEIRKLADGGVGNVYVPDITTTFAGVGEIDDDIISTFA